MEGILLKNMPDDLLLDAYYEAIELNLHPRFISLLKLEIRRRSISYQVEQPINKIS